MAENRIEDVWTYGEVRDDEARATPHIVLYSELSEEEKKYDRNTAMATLNLIAILGYKITK